MDVESCLANLHRVAFPSVLVSLAVAQRSIDIREDATAQPVLVLAEAV